MDELRTLHLLGRIITEWIITERILLSSENYLRPSLPSLPSFPRLIILGSSSLTFGAEGQFFLWWLELRYGSGGAPYIPPPMFQITGFVFQDRCSTFKKAEKKIYSFWKGKIVKNTFKILENCSKVSKSSENLWESFKTLQNPCECCIKIDGFLHSGKISKRLRLQKKSVK